MGNKTPKMSLVIEEENVTNVMFEARDLAQIVDLNCSTQTERIKDGKKTGNVGETNK